jgi:hypothetical protein
MDLPPIIYWLTKTGVVLTSVFDAGLAELSEARDTNGCAANRIVCRRWRPPFVTAWRTRPDEPWRPMADCPVA